MGYLKAIGWIIGVTLLIGVVFIVLPMLIKEYLVRKSTWFRNHVENYGENYKRIGITVIVIVVVIWYFNQPSDNRVCISRDHMGCIEWEYTD